MTQGVLRIGTRSSPLALAQARMVADALTARGARCEIMPMKTAGDRIQDRALIALGGKGLFTEEIEAALLEGRIDCAVHSSKDMPTALPDGLVLGCFLPREDPRDTLIAHAARSVADLPSGATIGTASLRRAAQLLNRRPDLKIATLRGNVQTRLDKLSAGRVDATLLAQAGLNRLGLDLDHATPLDTDIMLPAPAQGAICVERRSSDALMARYCDDLNDHATKAAVTAERAFLARLDGSCRTPIAALARISGDRLEFRGRILSPDGRVCHAVARAGPVAEAAALGDAAGSHLRSEAGAAFFARLQAAMKT